MDDARFPPPLRTLEDPELLPFLPLVYVAWADGLLSTAEREEIGRLAEELERLEGGASPDRAARLLAWLDPDSPPTSVELAQMRDRIRSLGAAVSPSEAHSLAALGAAIARATLGSTGPWNSEGALRTLRAVEDVLGVLGRESARELLSDPGDGLPTAPPPPFDVLRMRRYLDGAQGPLRRELMDLLRDPRFQPAESRGADPLPRAEARQRTLENLRFLAERGYGLRAMPVSVGGQDDVAGSIAIFETLAHGDLSLMIKFGVQFGLFGGSVLQLGTEAHHTRWLPQIATLELPGCYAMTELNHGSNVREIETTARYLPDADAFEIHTPHALARKEWIGNAALHGQLATVFAQLEVDGTEHGVHAFLVPIRDPKGTPLPGIEVEDCGPKVGLNGVDNGRLRFTRVRVPRENLLNRFGTVTREGRYESPIHAPGKRFFTMLGTLVNGRISIAAASNAVSRQALAIAIPYSDRRRQFGPSGGTEVPILDYLSHQRLLLPRLATTYALHFAVRDLVDLLVSAESEADHSRVEILAAGIKAVASRHAVDTVQAAREACGGQGYLAANRFGVLRNDVDIFTTFEGANPVLLQLVARGLLSRFRQELGEPNLRGMVRLIAERAGNEAQRRNPIRSRRTTEEFLRNPDVHREAFLFREERLLSSVARRLKHRLDQGMDSFDAMNACQDHLCSLALAHIEREVQESFRRAVDSTPDPELQAALDELSRFWALTRLEEASAWFLESGYMEGVQSRAIRAQVNLLCPVVRKSAVALVDAFGIPEDLLGAPAAIRDSEGD